MHRNCRIAVTLTASIFILAAVVSAQGRPQSTNDNGTTLPAQSNRSTANTGPRPYAEVITARAKTDRGLITTHRVDDKYYFEVPDSLLGREILVVNRISRAAAGARAGFIGYAGDQISDNVI